MDLIQNLFSEFREKILSDLAGMERHISYIVEKEGHGQSEGRGHKAPTSACDCESTEERFMTNMNHIQNELTALNMKLFRVESDNASLRRQLNEMTMSPPRLSGMRPAGLEGIFIRDPTAVLPSPSLSPISDVAPSQMPLIQRQMRLDVPEPDDEALEGELAEEMGGPVDEDAEEEEVEEVVEEEEVEDVVEEEVVEAEEQETLELDEFIYKGKTYYKTPDNMVYRANEDGEVEDEPFARFDPEANRLVRIV
jgi:hypothetical protein